MDRMQDCTYASRYQHFGRTNGGFGVFSLSNGWGKVAANEESIERSFRTKVNSIPRGISRPPLTREPQQLFGWICTQVWVWRILSNAAEVSRKNGLLQK